MASLGTWPADIGVRACKFTNEANQIVNESPGSGSLQVIDRLNDRWHASILLPVKKHADAAAIEAFIASFRGQVNWVRAWHFARPQPRGTLRGAPTLSSAAARGADEIRIQTTAGATLLKGDLLGVGDRIVMSAADATANASGIIVVPLINRIRVALAVDAVVTWNKPTTSFHLVAHSGVNYIPGITDEVSLELRERVA